MDLIKNSSDLSSGRRPISKSDEFSIRSILVLEITGREFDTFPKNVYTYWDFGSKGKAPNLIDSGHAMEAHA